MLPSRPCPDLPAFYPPFSSSDYSDASVISPANFLRSYFILTQFRAAFFPSVRPSFTLVGSKTKGNIADLTPYLSVLNKVKVHTAWRCDGKQNDRYI
jgi:hypothetical protein